MVRNDYYNMNTDDVRSVVGICEDCGVYSIAVAGYEWLLHKGAAKKAEYARLAALYEQRGDLFNSYRVAARYREIYR